jgi:hypothetical protein
MRSPAPPRRSVVWSVVGGVVGLTMFGVGCWGLGRLAGRASMCPAVCPGEPRVVYVRHDGVVRCDIRGSYRLRLGAAGLVELVPVLEGTGLAVADRHGQ